MSLNFYDALDSEPEVRNYFIRFLGTGASSPTKVSGNGVTITWISTGLYEILWKEDPKNYFGIGGVCFEATVPAGVKGYTVVPGVYNASTKKLQVSVYNSAFALADLAALQWLSLTVKFKETKVS